MSTTVRGVGEVLRRCREEGRAALIGYLPVGFPTVEGSIEAMRVLVDAGCDIVEVGVPYSDPLMDGPVIQHAAATALAGGSHVDDVFLATAAVREAGGSPLVMTYWNLVLRRGVARFAADLAAGGGAGLITPDLIPEEADDWIAASDEHGLDRVFLVAPSSTPERLVKVTRASRGFVYAASTMGVTGARTSVDSHARDLVERTRAVSDLPVCVGLGRVERCAGRRAGRLRRRGHRRVRPRAHPHGRRGTRRPARRVARTDGGARRRSEDGSTMSTEMDGATPVLADPEQPSAGRERLLDVIGTVARLFLGVVLIYAGAAKVGKPLTSERAVQAYELFPSDIASWIGLALPFVEIALGVLLVLGLFTRPVAIASTLLMVAFVIGISQAWARGLTIDCGCFGGGGQIGANETKYPQEIARDVAFALAGAWLWWRPRTLASLDRYLFGH